MRVISTSGSGLAVRSHIQGLSDGKVDIGNVGEEAQGLSEDMVEEVGVERDNGAEGEFKVELEVGVGGGEVCRGQG